MLVTQRTQQIEFGDCDPAGIVWYPRYFQFFDYSTAHHFQLAGIGQRDAEERYGALGWPMVDTRARYLVPSSYGDTVTIETRIMRWGRSSFDIEHRILRDGGTLAVEGFETRVWVRKHPAERARMQSMPVPDEVKAAFA